MPKTVKGALFSRKVSPGQSRIYLLEELNERPYVGDLSLNFNNIYDELDIEHTGKEQLPNLSVIENNIMEEETEEFFLFSQDRITPVLVNLDEIVEEVQERRSKSPSRMYEMVQNHEEKEEEFDDYQKLATNGRIFRKSAEQIVFRPKKPKHLKPVPPLSSPGFVRRIRKSRSSQDLSHMDLLNFDDYKKIGTKDLYNNLNVYEGKHYRPSRDDWMD